MASLHRTRPETLDEITIQVAIVRPGPIVGGAVNPYIDRRQRLREDPSFQMPYEHPSLEEPLRDTLGTIIFQDQVIEVAMAFAGFTPGEAEGLRRAMSRKRSEAAIRAHTERFVEGAQDDAPRRDEASAERVYEMVVGFSGFGFPKAHGAAFGLLAYQSAWLRVHYGPEFLCSLLDEQPMGFYPSDALVHEAQRRGIEVLPADINASARRLHRHAGGRAVRIGLGYVLGVRADEVAALVAAREEGGPFRSLEDLASRAGAGRPTLERLAWSGACDALSTATAASRCGSSASPRPGDGVRRRGDAARRCRSTCPAPPQLKPLTGWPTMVADYATTGPDDRRAPDGPAARRSSTSAARCTAATCASCATGSRCASAGSSSRASARAPRRASSFMLLEDEHGTINLVVPPEIYERDRLVVRSEPLVIAEGVLERHPAAGGAINVLVRAHRGRSTRRTARWPRSPSSPGTSRCRTSRRRTPRSSRGGGRGGRRGWPPTAAASARSRRPSSRSRSGRRR